MKKEGKRRKAANATGMNSSNMRREALQGTELQLKDVAANIVIRGAVRSDILVSIFGDEKQTDEVMISHNDAGIVEISSCHTRKSWVSSDGANYNVGTNYGVIGDTHCVTVNCICVDENTGIVVSRCVSDGGKRQKCGNGVFNLLRISILVPFGLPINLESGLGSIQLNDVRGPVEADLSDNAQLSGSKVGKLKLQLDDQARVELEEVGGEVKLRASGQAMATLRTSTIDLLNVGLKDMAQAWIYSQIHIAKLKASDMSSLEIHGSVGICRKKKTSAFASIVVD